MTFVLRDSDGLA